MNLNCKVGDIAVCNKKFTKTETGANLGKIVTCLELMPIGASIMGYTVIDDPKFRIWKVDGDFWWACRDGYSVSIPYAMDCVLTPLRDTDGEDEMLALAGMPNVMIIHG